MLDRFFPLIAILIVVGMVGLVIAGVKYDNHKDSTKTEISREAIGKFVTADQTPGGWGTDDKTVVKTDKGVFVVDGHRVQGLESDECFLVHYNYGGARLEIGKFSYRLR